MKGGFLLKTLPQYALGIAHGKIILMGEHSVVYGEPAIALPFPAVEIQAKTTNNKGPVTVESFYYSGTLNEVPSLLENIKAVIEKTCHTLDQAVENFNIFIESSIPPQRGMGSSAAVSAAIVRSLYNFFEEPLSYEKLLELTDVGERIAHGNPSGLDAKATTSTDAVYFENGNDFSYMSIDMEAYLIVADSGEIGNTKETVQAVKNLLEKFPEDTEEIIHKLGDLVTYAKDAIDFKDPRTLGTLMSKAHHYLKKLTVSNETLDHLTETAIQNGAIGAKLTGGGRGGCMIALSENKEDAKKIAEALEDAGAIQTWVHSLKMGEL